MEFKFESLILYSLNYTFTTIESLLYSRFILCCHSNGTFLKWVTPFIPRTSLGGEEMVTGEAIQAKSIETDP